MNYSHDNAQTDREALERYRPETLTHATTVPQPLAWALASGHCPVICSDTRPDMARIGELIGIHAAARASSSDEHDAFYSTHHLAPNNRPTHSEYRTLPRGALVGVARLKGVIQAKSGDPIRFWRVQGRSACVGEYASEDMAARIRPWWPSGTKWGLLLDEAVPLSEPIPMRGAGGLWRLPNRVLLPSGPHQMARCLDGEGLAAWALEQWRKGRAER